MTSLRNFISGINLHMYIFNKRKIPLRILSDLSCKNKTMNSRSISFHPTTSHKFKFSAYLRKPESWQGQYTEEMTPFSTPILLS